MGAREREFELTARVESFERVGSSATFDFRAAVAASVGMDDVLSSELGVDRAQHVSLRLASGTQPSVVRVECCGLDGWDAAGEGVVGAGAAAVAEDDVVVLVCVCVWLLFLRRVFVGERKRLKKK